MGAEAERRGLLNNKNTADAVPEFFKQENIDVFVDQGVYTQSEAIARAKIQLENYVKTIRIEALTMLDMAKKQIYPAVSAYVGELCANLAAKKSVVADLPCAEEEALIKTLASCNENMMAAVRKLEADLSDIPEGEREASPADGARRRTRHGEYPRICRPGGKALLGGLLALPDLFRFAVQHQISPAALESRGGAAA